MAKLFVVIAKQFHAWEIITNEVEFEEACLELEDLLEDEPTRDAWVVEATIAAKLAADGGDPIPRWDWNGTKYE